MSPSFLPWVRYAVLAVAGALALLGFAAMAVQRRSINPFSRTARLVRRLSDPLIKPVERRLIRAGHNPQSAPTWLVGLALVGGILVITIAEWLARQLFMMQAAQAYGEQTRSLVILVTVVNWAFNIIEIALVVRVIGSWFGMDRYHPLMKPVVFLTEWMLAPLRRVVPAFGMFDITPVVAWLLLHYVVRRLAFQLLFALV